MIKAFCWTWSAALTLTEAFEEVIERCQTLRVEPALITDQGFMAALVKWSGGFIGNLLAAMHLHPAIIGSRF